MNGLDGFIILVVTLSVIYSFFRGLIREAFSLLGLIVGLVAASKGYAVLADSLLRQLASRPLAGIIAFLVIFVATSLIFSLGGALISKFVHTIHLRLLDRLLGALFGLGKGIVIVTVVVFTLVAFLPPAPPLLTHSRLSPYVVSLGKVPLSMVPDGFGRRVREKAEILQRYWREFPENQRSREGVNCSLMRSNSCFSLFRIARA